LERGAPTFPQEKPPFYIVASSMRAAMEKFTVAWHFSLFAELLTAGKVTALRHDERQEDILIRKRFSLNV
jgi:hypothetical protein